MNSEVSRNCIPKLHEPFSESMKSPGFSRLLLDFCPSIFFARGTCTRVAAWRRGEGERGRAGNSH